MNRYTKITNEHLSLENSFGTIREEKGVELHCELGIHENAETGWFEIYDFKTGGNEWHAEGGLWFEGKDVVDYDGVFSLPQGVTDLLKEHGYKTEEIE
tara:strand:- start:1097 stop:1390 length:294 start_codon:yes stop_codon:yes gene_type:complete